VAKIGRAERSARRIARDGNTAVEGVAADGCGGGTAAWQPGRGHMVYVGSYPCQRKRRAEIDAPISARRRSFSSCHLRLKSFPTTPSTSSGSMSAEKSVDGDLVSLIARFFTQETLGHETFSRVPSSMASDQQLLKHGVQLDEG
jgi:hypothetical protein